MSVGSGPQPRWLDVRAGKRMPFVGRDEERATLRQLLDEAAGGLGTVAMVGGEPGVGKTRLAEELAVEGRGLGFFTVTGHCYDTQGGVPYQPFVEALDYVARVVPAVGLRQWLGDGGPEVARLAPGLRRRLPDLPPAAEAPPEEGRRLLLTAWSDLIQRAAHVQPILLILEDVHWADESSLLLLQHLARRLTKSPVMVLCTYRDVDLDVTRPLATTFQELVRQRLALDLVLGPLSEQGVARMIAAHGPGTPPARLASLVYNQTEGNPFFVEEVLRHLAEEDKLVTSDDHWVSNVAISELEVPRSVRLVIQQRLARLSDGCQHLLASAAVVGREFSFEVVEALGDLEPERLIDAIEEAARAGLIRDVASGAEARYSFAHELGRQTLLSGLSLPRRQRLHLRVAETMEHLYGSTPDSHVAELAYHYRQAGAAAGVAKTIEYSARAGRRAMQQYAYADAARHFRNALEARGDRPTDNDAAGLLFELGEACDIAFQHVEAWGCFERASSYYLETAQASRAKDVAVLAGSRWYYLGPKQLEMVERALGLAEEGTEAFASLCVALGFSASWQGDDARAQQAFSQAHDLANRLGLPLLSLAALRFEMEADFYRGRLASLLARAEQVVDLARKFAIPLFEVAALLFRGVATASLGDLDSGRRDANAARVLAERMQLGTVVFTLITWQTSMAMWAGDWQAMRSGLAASFEIDPDEPTQLQHATMLPLLLGDSETAEAHIQKLVGAMNAAASGPRPYDGLRMTCAALAGVLSFATAYAGRRPEPELIGRAAQIALSSETPSAPVVAHLLRQALVQEAFRNHDSEAAQGLFTHFEPLRGTVYGGIPVDYLLGLLFVTMDQAGEAIEALEAGLTSYGNGYRTWYALAAHECARARLGRNGPGDHQRASVLLDECHAISTELGMKPLLERARALRDSLDAHRHGRATYPDGLTPREVEVLRLVAAGRTNKQIADDLVISLNTVLRHVSHIFDKTGASNRVEAAAYAHRHGIESPPAD